MSIVLGSAATPSVASPRVRADGPGRGTPRRQHKRVLLISYPFPPVGGAGVQRVTKFVKYLPHCGWLPSVLTVANPSVPLRDESLSAEVPEGTIVRRARTWEPGYAVKAAVSAGGGQPGRGAGLVRRLLKGLARTLSNVMLQPDPQVLWVPPAIREGKRLLEQVPHDAIVATGPPFSTFLAGAALSRKARIPLVLDYRDEWDLSNAYLENKKLGPLSCRLQQRLQRSVVRSARALLATTPGSARALERVRADARSGARVAWIYNGYDPDDFPPRGRAGRDSGGPCRLLYAGTLWNLTSVAPLVEGVHALTRNWPDLTPQLELVFTGRCTGAQEQLLERLQSLPCRVRRHPYLPHDQAVEQMAAADAACVLLADLPGAERVVPAKVFEYMATGRPILAIAPRGELWDVLAAYPAARCVTPSDTEAVAANLAGILRAHADGSLRPVPPWDSRPFSRPHQARELAALLDSLVPLVAG